LLEAILARYVSDKLKQGNEKMEAVVRSRCFNFVKTWIKKFPYDFDDFERSIALKENIQLLKGAMRSFAPEQEKQLEELIEKTKIETKEIALYNSINKLQEKLKKSTIASTNITSRF